MDKIILAERLSASTKIHLAYLKELYNSVELIVKEPEWENCFHVSADDIENNLDVVLSIAAGYLQHHNKVAIKIAQMPNALFIKTNQGN